MTNNIKHQSKQHVFSNQSHPATEQFFPTSGLGPTIQRSNGYHPAGMPRILPLDVKTDISRNSARQPADRIGEWPDHPTRANPRSMWNIRNRPEAVPTHIRLSEPNEVRGPHQRQVVTLLQFDSINRARIASTPAAPAPGQTPMHPDTPAGERP
jgi:hypothetical protein